MPKKKNKINPITIIKIILFIFVGLLTILWIIGYVITNQKENLKNQLLELKAGKLTSISVNLAKELRKDNGGVDYGDDSPTNKITSITPEVFKELISNPDGPNFISLNGLTNISLEVAKELHGYSISLNGLKTISPEVARELANNGSLYLSLKGIESISGDAAKELAKDKSFIIGNEYLMQELYKYGYSPSDELRKAHE